MALESVRGIFWLYSLTFSIFIADYYNYKPRSHNFQMGPESSIAQDKGGTVADAAAHYHTPMYTRNIGRFS